ncbi:hypothetical protein ACFWC2_14310 [Streptomyces diastaticus]|uniref:hypothetical protein n=1 Tax=Streptomyces diastaticus TaxID=1956 RepID=UPI0036554D23
MSARTRCRACGNPKPARTYLCPPCWRQLPDDARRLLSHTGDRARAMARLRELHHHIDSGHPLAELEITP